MRVFGRLSMTKNFGANYVKNSLPIASSIASRIKLNIIFRMITCSKINTCYVRSGAKKDGYVSIKLITSFKKVKKLTKDWAVVRSAIVRRSKTLVVSPEGLRIKRRLELSETLKKPRLLTSILVSKIYNFL